MAASLLDLLSAEKELVERIDEIDKLIKENEKMRNDLLAEKHLAEMKLKSRRSILAGYIEKNLVKYPNHDPYKNPEV